MWRLDALAARPNRHRDGRPFHLDSGLSRFRPHMLVFQK